MNRFDYVKYDEEAAFKQAIIKDAFSLLAELLEKQLGPGRATSLALTKLEESYMWVGKQIRDEQVAKSGENSAPLQEERKDG